MNDRVAPFREALHRRRETPTNRINSATLSLNDASNRTPRAARSGEEGTCVLVGAPV
jgi:hypothetical protein